MEQIDSAEDTKPITEESKSRSVKLAVIVIAAIVVASLALAYLYTDVFGDSAQKATIQVNSLSYPDDVQYEIYLNRTGEMLVSGTLVSNGSEIHEFKGFAAEEIMFRYTGLPDLDLVCPYLLSDGQMLQIQIFPYGSVGWALSY